MANRVRVVLDNRLRIARADLDPECEAALVAAFTHKNPKLSKNRAMGFSTWQVAPTICTARMTSKQLTLPRGGTQQVREVLAARGLAPEWVDRRLELEPVEMPELRLTLRGYQAGAVEAMARRENCILRAPTGCMAGDSVVGVNRAGKSFRIRLDELVRKHNGGENEVSKNNWKSWDPSIPTTVRARMDDGTIRLVRLVDAYESGTKPVYEVKTRSGHRVVATADHRLLTQDGWKCLGAVTVGDRLHVESPRRKGGKRKSRSWYRLVSGLMWHPYVGRKGVKSGKGGWSVPLHRLVAEARSNGLDVTEFVARVRAGQVERLTFLDPDIWDVHHVDEDSLNNESSNLEVVTKAEHQKRHASPEHVLPRTMTSEIVSIRSLGFRPTYDLALEAPHNFLANGVVVHNSGKTCAAFALIVRLRQPALVILWSANLLRQWKDRLKSDLGMRDRDIGVIRGQRRSIAPITLAMQQSLWSRGIPEEVSGNFGLVLIDEAQRVAAQTVRTVVDAFPARYRFAISADERRKDGLDFLTREVFGPVAADIKRRDLVRDGSIHDVAVRVSPTEFEAPWYGDEGASAKDAYDFNRLLDEMTHDERRNGLVLGTVECEAAGGRQVLVFTHRVEHARMLSDAITVQLGQPCGLLIGGPENAVRFEEDRAAILSGSMRVAVGTVQAIGQGLDLPSVDRGVVATPVAGNKQLFDQVRGRICRRSDGKEDAELIYLLDWRVYPSHLRNIEGWCDEVFAEWETGIEDLRERCAALVRARREAREGRRGGEQRVPGFDD